MSDRTGRLPRDIPLITGRAPAFYIPQRIYILHSTFWFYSSILHSGVYILHSTFYSSILHSAFATSQGGAVETGCSDVY